MRKCVICNNNTSDYIYIYICNAEKDRVLQIYRNYDTERNRYNKAIEELQKLYAERNRYNKTIKELQKLLHEKNNELNIMRDKEKRFNEFYKNFEGNKKKADEFYDTILNINSILDINKGWEIKFNSKKGKEEYDKMIK